MSEPVTMELHNEAMRRIEQGAVRVEGERVEDKALRLSGAQTLVMQVGKRRFARVKLLAG